MKLTHEALQHLCLTQAHHDQQLAQLKEWWAEGCESGTALRLLKLLILSPASLATAPPAIQNQFHRVLVIMLTDLTLDWLQAQQEPAPEAE